MKKEKSAKRKNLKRKVARLRNVNALESCNSWTLGCGNEIQILQTRIIKKIIIIIIKMMMMMMMMMMI